MDFIESISVLTQREDILLRGSFMATVEEKFNCFKCQNDYRRDEKLIKVLRERKGCFGSDKILYGLGNYQLKTCVGNLTTPDFEHIMYLYDNYERGVLPFDGSPSDQPNKIVEIFNLIYSLTAEHKEKLRRQAEASSRKR